jgi:hypothetical protein
MLATLRSGIRFRIAFAMAAFAVFAFVAPPIAVAFAPTEGAVYCLTHNDHAIGHEQVDHAADHEHHPGDLDQVKHSHQGDKHPSHCCGLFCVAALAPEVRQLANPPLEGPQLSAFVVPGFHRRLPELHFRPPISPLSF